MLIRISLFSADFADEFDIAPSRNTVPTLQKDIVTVTARHPIPNGAGNTLVKLPFLYTHLF